MAYRIFSLLPLLAVCISAATPTAEMAPEMASMNEAMTNLSSAVPVQAVSPAATALPAAPVTDKSEGEAQVQQASAVQPVISHSQANTVIQAAVAKATELKIPSNIAVTDPYGHLVSFLRMDGALLVSIDVAQKKAKTVSMFGGKFRSGDLYNMTSPGGALYGMQQTNNGLIFFGGGVPLTLNKTFVGSLGVSGGSVEQDVAIASAAALALQ